MDKRDGQGISESGFTIIELVVVVCLIAIFGAIAIPSFSVMTKAQSKKAARETFEADVRRGRALAISEGARVIFTMSSGGNIYTLGTDYPPYNSPAAVDSTLYRTVLPENCTVSASNQLIFNSRGMMITVDGTLTTSNIIYAYSGTTFATGTIPSSGTGVN